MFMDMGEDVLRCSLQSVPKSPSNSPMYSSSAVYLGGHNLTYRLALLFCVILYLVLGGHQKVPDGVTPLKWNLYSHFVTHHFLKLSSKSLGVGDIYEYVAIILLLLLLVQCYLWRLFWAWLILYLWLMLVWSPSKGPCWVMASNEELF